MEWHGRDLKLREKNEERANDKKFMAWSRSPSAFLYRRFRFLKTLNFDFTFREFNSVENALLKPPCLVAFLPIPLEVNFVYFSSLLSVFIKLFLYSIFKQVAHF